MTLDEFEEEVRRVLPLLGLSPETAITVEEARVPNSLPTTFYADIVKGENFQFSIDRYGSEWRLQIADDMSHLNDTGSVLFRRMRLSASESQMKHLPLMLRVLVHLGYDVDALCAQGGIALTAHEKLEWGLESGKVRPGE